MEAHKQKNQQVNQITNEAQYKKLFEKVEDKDKIEVIKIILDTRKFEIDLYWKRSAYFFTIIGALYAGFFTVFANFKEGDDNKLKILFLLNSLGIVFSMGWYFVNRGSKFWQLNWEKHIAAMEDSIIGPLFKTRISIKHYSRFQQFFKLTAPFAFSVSKINQVLNLTILLSWFLSFYYMAHKYLQPALAWNFYTGLIILTVLEITGLLFFCLTERRVAGGKWINHTYMNFDQTFLKDGEKDTDVPKKNK